MFSATMDNASYNDTAIGNLKVYFELRKLPLYLGRSLFHVRCCAHILNLLVQYELGEITYSG